MARYLNRAEKDNVMKTAITKVWLEDTLKIAEEKTPSKKKYITALKYARTYIEKLLAEMLDGKDEIQIAYTILEAKKYRFVMVGTKEALRKQEENKKSSRVVHIEREKVEKLINLAFANCGMCESTGDDVTNCKYRELLIDLEVEPLDVESECCFRYEYK